MFREEWFWASGRVVVLGIFLVGLTVGGYAEVSNPQILQTLQLQTGRPLVASPNVYHAAPAPLLEPEAGRVPEQVVENPRLISFDRLRRESYRYPDQDLLGRWIEVSTQLPPLFGAQEE